MTKKIGNLLRDYDDVRIENQANKLMVAELVKALEKRIEN